MEEFGRFSGPDRRKLRWAAHTKCMTMRLRFYRLCNVVMELERLQPVMDAVQTVGEVVALLPF